MSRVRVIELAASIAALIPSSRRSNAGSIAVNPGLMVWIVAVIPGSKSL
jgi:hypothetical protein